MSRFYSTHIPLTNLETFVINIPFPNAVSDIYIKNYFLIHRNDIGFHVLSLCALAQVFKSAK